jgi:peptidyl-prolyl cis-trans isomerase SurA
LQRSVISRISTIAMSGMGQNSAMLAAAAIVLLVAGPSALGSPRVQSAPQSPSTVPTAQPPSSAPQAAAKPSPPHNLPIDRVVAIVNGDLILESDVDEERRLAAFQPYSSPAGGFSRQEAIDRLIDRTLILQQDGEQALPPLTDSDVNADILELRKAIFACRQYHCETEAGWQNFLIANGFTDQEFKLRWRDRMVTLRFIEQRFRMGIRIEQAEIDDYYEKTLLPEYARRHVTPPNLDTIHDRIHEILLQQRVSRLLDDWLKTLRASGDVQMVKSGGGTR